MTVQWLYNCLNSIAPFDTAEAYDNPGLLTGRMDQVITGVLLALDCTPQTVEEAKALGANVIVTHHPLMFAPRQNLREDDYEGGLICSLIRANIALIAAHTNLDIAPGGINDALAQRLGLKRIAGEGFVRAGDLPEPMSAEKLAEYCVARLNTVVRLCGPKTAVISRLGMCSGAGSGEWRQAVAWGAQAFLAGEVKHHHGVEAAQAGIPLLEAGHFATENPGMDLLADALQKAADEVQYNLHLYRTQSDPYGNA